MENITKQKNSQDIINHKGGTQWIKQEKLKGKTQQEIIESIGFKSPAIITTYLTNHHIKWKDLPSPNKPEQKIEQFIKTCNKNTVFNTITELAEAIGVNHNTLKKWVQDTKYTWEDLHLKQPLKKQILNKGGAEYIKKRFNENCTIDELVKEFGGNYQYVNSMINLILTEAGTSKKELGYGSINNDEIIEEKGGLAYLLECKINGLSMNDIVETLGLDSYSAVRDYLSKKGINYSELTYVEDVYYVPHLKKWRGTIATKNTIHDTQLYDTIWEALKETQFLKKIIDKNS